MQTGSFLHSVETPAFVYDEAEITRVLDITESLRRTTGSRVLYSVKPLTFAPLLEFMAPRLDGFAVSSPYEARLAKEFLPAGGSLHFTSPGIRDNEVEDLRRLCGYVSFNSLTQWHRFAPKLEGGVRLGLRVNPQLSFLEDERYDPCREDSKLGVPLAELSSLQNVGKDIMGGLSGILVHSNCEATDFGELQRTVDRLAEGIPEVLERISWINLGGGYLFQEDADVSPLCHAVERLRQEYQLEVFLEPGAAFVRSAGYIVSTVLDVFANGSKRIAVLDSTVNHMPELLEFDFEPDIAEHDDRGGWDYVLAGCTCLAGDVFGEYSFSEPLETGDRITFCNVGSYTLTKAHMFNGVNLPNIYALNGQGDLQLIRRFDFLDYATRWGSHAGSSV